MLRIGIASVVLALLAIAAHGQTFGDGTHVIGIDIQPGIYRAPGGEWCQWYRLPDLSGDITKAHAYGFMATKPTVEVESTDKAFRAQNCGTWEVLGNASTATSAPTSDYETAIVAASAVIIALGKIVKAVTANADAEGITAIKDTARMLAISTLTTPGQKQLAGEMVDLFDLTLDTAQ